MAKRSKSQPEWMNNEKVQTGENCTTHTLMITDDDDDNNNSYLCIS